MTTTQDEPYLGQDQALPQIPDMVDETRDSEQVNCSNIHMQQILRNNNRIDKILGRY